MRGIEDLLGKPLAGTDEVVLRICLPASPGWVVKRHGEIYTAEHRAGPPSSKGWSPRSSVSS